MKNERGFSLIEVLIAIGLMGALSAWMMNIFTQQTKNEKTTATNMDIDSLGQEIRNVVANGDSCAKTFLGVDPNQVGAITEIQKVLSDGSVQKRFQSGSKRVGNSGLLIASYDLKTDETYFIPTGQKTGETVLSINYDRGKMVQGAKLKTYKIPLSVALDESGKIMGCSALASSTNLASICSSLGRSVGIENKKCDPPTIFKKGQTPVHLKQYAACEGGTGPAEHVLDTWTADGSGSATLSWSGIANDTQILWRVYQNNLVIYSANASGVSSDLKSQDVTFVKGDIFKHTVQLNGGVDSNCIMGGSFSVGLDLLNM